MKICVINSLYPPYHRGGAEVVVQKIISGLQSLGHQVVLITLGRREGVERHGDLTIYRIKPFNVFSFIDINQQPLWRRLLWHLLDVFNLSGAQKVKKILAHEQPTVVLTHNLKGIGYLVPRAIRQAGRRHIHTVHDVQLSRPSGIILHGQEKPFLILDKVYEKICRWLFNDPQVVISPSSWLLEYYKKRGFFYKSQKAVLPNPVTFQNVKKRPEEQLTTSSRLTLLYVGQLERVKGILFLIAACKKISGQNWRLLIAGTGNIQAKVEAAIEGDARFIFVGRVEPHQVAELYRQADLTIVPSLCYENSPSVITESLVANVPVVAADIGGIGELVKDDYNGFTFAPGNEKNLLEVLEHFLKHPENVESLKKNCFVSVRNFSVANYLKKLLDLLNG